METRRRLPARLAVLCVLAMQFAPSAHAMPAPNPRDPQVVISGVGLQAYLDARGQEIDVHTEQDATQFWQALRCQGPSFWLVLELGVKSDGSSIGLYYESDGSLSLIEIFPPQAGAGWFASVEYIGPRARVTIYLHDEFGHHLGPVTYVGELNNVVGFYLHGAHGDFFTEDFRNPGGDPQLLSFLESWSYTRGWWIAAEDTPLSAGADRDFDDMIMFVSWPDCPLPVQRSTWGAVKSRFR